MKQLSMVVGFVLLLAAPAGAQIIPGFPADVYDANGSYIGYYVGRSFQTPNSVQFDVALEHDGQMAIVRFAQDRWGTGYWGPQDYLLFSDTECAGTPAIAALADVPITAPDSQGGYRYIAKNATLYRFDVAVPAQELFLFSKREIETCQFQPGGGPYQAYAGEVVGSLSSAFPFHLRVSSLHAPAFPPSAFMLTAMLIAAAGGGFLVRRLK